MVLYPEPPLIHSDFSSMVGMFDSDPYRESVAGVVTARSTRLLVAYPQYHSERGKAKNKNIELPGTLQGTVHGGSRSLTDDQDRLGSCQFYQRHRHPLPFPEHTSPTQHRLPRESRTTTMIMKNLSHQPEKGRWDCSKMTDKGLQ